MQLPVATRRGAAYLVAAGRWCAGDHDYQERVPVRILGVQRASLGHHRGTHGPPRECESRFRTVDAREPTPTEAPVEARPVRRRRVGRPARPPAAVLCVAAILTAAITVGLLTRPGASSRPTPRITAATPPPVPAAPPPPRTRPRAVQPRQQPHAPVITHPVAVKPTRTLPPPRLSRQVARLHHTALRVGSAVGEFAP